MPLIDQVRAAVEGSDEAFEKLFEAYHAAVFAAALARLGNFADAEDAAQETFIEAWRKLPRLRDPTKFAGWLRRIAIGRCGRISRCPKVVGKDIGPMSQIASNAPGPAFVAERNEAAAVADRAVAVLPRAQREALVLFASGFSYRHIAVLLGVPLGTVKRRIHDSRRALEKSMYDLASVAIQHRIQRAQDKLLHDLGIPEEVARMKALLKAIGSATRDAVNEMYRTCDRIELADGKINGEPVSPEAYAAVMERIRFNADLAGPSFKPGARSQVLLMCDGRRRDFEVEVGTQKELVLTLRA